MFSVDRGAFLGYRVEAGVLLLCGDPVGSPPAMRDLLRQACAFAEEHGLRIAAVNASGDLLPLYEEAGLRSLYIGDEAIVDTAAFSLDGRAIRKVRQSVNRIERAGYTAEVAELGALTPADVTELERVARSWRDGRAQRGFSMALDSLCAEDQADTLVVAARDGSGTTRAFLHFVPVYGRPAVSLSAMCREHESPNGLTEFLVVKAIELLRDRGISDVSLNFAAFARLLHAPQGRKERLLGRIAAAANPYFQIESLYRFSAKFFPRWEPRYLVYEGRLGLPRAGLATLWAEGQLPRTALRRPARSQ
jgi:lysyl-tRNA synthetase class 2